MPLRAGGPASDWAWGLSLRLPGWPAGAGPQAGPRRATWRHAAALPRASAAAALGPLAPTASGTLRYYDIIVFL